MNEPGKRAEALRASHAARARAAPRRGLGRSRDGEGFAEPRVFGRARGGRRGCAFARAPVPWSSVEAFCFHHAHVATHRHIVTRPHAPPLVPEAAAVSAAAVSAAAAPARGGSRLAAPPRGHARRGEGSEGRFRNDET